MDKLCSFQAECYDLGAATIAETHHNWDVLRTGQVMPSLPKGDFQDAEVGGVHHSVVVEVCRSQPILSELALEGGEVDNVDSIVGVGVATLLCTEFLSSLASTDHQ